MTSKATSIDQYIAALPDDRKVAIEKLRNVIKKNLPEGFVEEISYGMVGYVVPHSIYPKGYHCNAKLPLPFISIASQKGFIALYHMGLYANKEVYDWFVTAYENLNLGEPDVGKSCTRFKKLDKIPYELIGALCTKFTVKDWITTYEANFVK